MMRNLILMAVISISMAALSSCSDDGQVVSTEDCPRTEMISYDNSTAYDDLHERIIAFNDGFFGDEGNATRGIFSRKWFRWVVVVLADAVGAGVGVGIVCGAICSGVAAPLLSNDIAIASGVVALSDSPSAYVSPSLVNSPDVAFTHIVPQQSNAISERSDSVGYYHNKVLFDLFTNVEMPFIVNLTQTELATIIAGEIMKEPYIQHYYGVKPLSDVDVDAMVAMSIEIVNNIIGAAQDSECEDDFYERLNDLGDEYQNVIPILKEIVGGLALLDIDDDGEYYQAIINTIYASEIDEDFKNRLIDSVIVAQASHRLWNISRYSQS